MALYGAPVELATVAKWLHSNRCQVSTYMAIVIPLNPELRVRLG